MSLAVPPPFAALPDASACGGREAAAGRRERRVASAARPKHTADIAGR